MSELHSQVCFDALSILNNVQVVETVCNLCGASHFTGNCPILRQGTYVADTPQQTFSRSSIPKGLIIMNSETEGTCVITSQKFAKGTRFGPLLAPATFFPTKETKFPLIIFPTHQYNNEETYDIQDLFTGRNIYLDTTDDSFCNWMVHVSPAKYSNEQNLCCYQENYEIYYAAIQDLELGDILKVWYSSTYASIMGAKLLEPSPFDIFCDETLADIKNDTEIALPPVMSLLKTTVHNFSNIKDDSLNIYDYNRSFSVNNEKNNRLMNNDTLND
ncbi:PR domain zinc finger protein 15-like [Culicoides brevitarsis]|uniref:PR domain zinc finger protein 15-like n=1 Tax=Culicoides brevitarsis TaxID=469753 RepID=UPI00307C1E8C